MRHTLTVVAFAVLVPVAALAQTTSPPATATQVLSTNPLGLMIRWANIEFERKITSEVTLGASVSHLAGSSDFGDSSRSNAAILLRWYPQQSALEGFYFGARAGAYRFHTFAYDYGPTARSGISPTTHERSTVLPGAGLEFGYNWLLGPRRNVSVGLGFGLTRIIGGGDCYGAPCILPGFRLVNIGIAF